ncbi:hypothetical protein K8R43_02405 [archaeon]|nr:hypothetical protein [archaeon]
MPRPRKKSAKPREQTWHHRYDKKELAKKILDVASKKHVVTIKELAGETGIPFNSWLSPTCSPRKVLFELHRKERIILYQGNPLSSYLVHNKPHKEIASEIHKSKWRTKNSMFPESKLLLSLEPGENRIEPQNHKQGVFAEKLAEKLPKIFEKSKKQGKRTTLTVKDGKKLFEMKQTALKVLKIWKR